jgi:predicted negative regulator of RcsB-dependent stress response
VGRRLTRKEIKKKDPITESLVGVWTWMVENRRVALIAIGIVLGAVVLYYVGSMWHSRSQSTRSLAMQKALEVYDGRVDPSAKEPKDNVFPTAQAKFSAALKTFQEIESSEGKSADGVLATYYKAACLRELGRVAEAEAALTQILPEVDDQHQLQVVQMALAETYRAGGKYDDALRMLDQLEKAENPAFSTEAIAYTRALCLEEKGKYQDALNLLQNTRTRIEEKKRSDPQYYTPYENAIIQRIESLRALARKG